MSHVMAELAREAQVLGALILHGPPPARAVQRYVDAAGALPTCTSAQRALLDVMVARPALAAAIDGGLALRAPHHPARLRVLVMLAILETEPELADTFLPRAPSSTEVLRVAVSACRAAALALAGAALLQVLPRD